jgi:hypothetical protein
MVVENKALCVISCAGILFLPGANIIADNLCDAAKADFGFSKYTKAGIFSIIVGKKNGEAMTVATDVDPFFSLTAAQAKVVAKSLLDRVKIIALLKDEKRANIRLLLEKQLEILSKDETKNDKPT